MRVLPLLALLSACSTDSALSSGQYGVSPGGSQDIALAHDLIEAGQIPARDHFTAEGLFSEHDLPLEGAACTQLLCPRAAAAYQAPVDGGPARYVAQLGFGTSISEETFTRAPVRIAVTIDTSGSMEGPDRLGAVQDAVLAMIPQLDEHDQVALVVYGSEARLVKPMTTMDAAGREAMERAVRDLTTEGSTNMEAGMVIAYHALAEGSDGAGVEERLMLFTDAQPNTGDVSPTGFLGLVRTGADDGIGITVLGVGLDLGSELADALAQTRGGNSYYLPDAASAATLFEEEFPFMVTPLAYDLAVELVPAEGVTLGEGYGMPVDGLTSAFGASTLFLSRSDGALAITLDAPALDPGAALGTLSLSYAPADGAPVVSDALALAWEGGAAWSGAAGLGDDLGAYKLSVLLDAYQALLAGADLCAGTLPRPDAVARIELATERLDAVAIELPDAPIADLGVLIGMLGDLAAADPLPCADADAYIY
ncbi:MAG: VWA domain-containing protein [Pseudomonadota bacterium]|nr:VWA domain-containing protein [Pseudomonadota bacterium]